MLESLYTKKSVRYKWNSGIRLLSQRNQSVSGEQISNDIW